MIINLIYPKTTPPPGGVPTNFSGEREWINVPKATTNLGTVNGVETAVHTEDGTGKFHVTKKQNVQPTLDYT